MLISAILVIPTRPSPIDRTAVLAVLGPVVLGIASIAILLALSRLRAVRQFPRTITAVRARRAAADDDLRRFWETSDRNVRLSRHLLALADTTDDPELAMRLWLAREAVLCERYANAPDLARLLDDDRSDSPSTTGKNAASPD